MEFGEQPGDGRRQPPGRAPAQGMPTTPIGFPNPLREEWAPDQYGAVTQTKVSEGMVALGEDFNPSRLYTPGPGGGLQGLRPGALGQGPEPAPESGRGAPFQQYPAFRQKDEEMGPAFGDR